MWIYTVPSQITGILKAKVLQIETSAKCYSTCQHVDSKYLVPIVLTVYTVISRRTTALGLHGHYRKKVAKLNFEIQSKTYFPLLKRNAKYFGFFIHF